MIYTGTYNEFNFLQVAKDGYDFKRFVEEYEKLIIGKAVGVVSFDGDSVKPTKEEYERGWKYDSKEVAYFDKLNTYELKTDIFANCYDEWYLFEEPTQLKGNHIFVTYSGFRLHIEKEDRLMRNVQKRFWDQVEQNNPNSFVIYGDNFIYGSKNKNDIDQIEKAWR